MSSSLQHGVNQERHRAVLQPPVRLGSLGTWLRVQAGEDKGGTMLGLLPREDACCAWRDGLLCMCLCCHGVQRQPLNSPPPLALLSTLLK